MAFSGSQITRLGLSGVPRPIYASFASKTGTVAAAICGFVTPLIDGFIAAFVTEFCVGKRIDSS